MTHLSHKIRLYPNNAQRTHFARACGISRFAYNWGLDQCKTALAEQKAAPSGYDLSKQLNAIKKEKFPWMQEVSKWAPQQAVHDLGDAFKKYFQKKARHPKFKKKGRCKDSFYINANAFKIEGPKIRISRLGWVKMAEELRFPGRPLSAVISREADAWYAAVQVELPDDWRYPHACKSQASVGVDLGIKDLVVLSNGEKHPGPKALRKLEPKLRKLNKELSRKKRGSRRRNATKARLGRLHARIAHIRGDYAHKLSTDLVQRFGQIAVEDLDIRGMLQNRHLAKYISDAGWYEFRRQLEYKGELAGCQVVVVDRDFPSSQLCSQCGDLNERLALGKRKWVCSNCGTAHDRDVNAAINLNEQVAQGYWETENGRGEGISLGACPQQSSVKRQGGIHGC
jgi:putative transposase